MVGVFRRWLGVTTLRKIKAEWRKTDVWCTISSPWYVDVVVPQIHRKWRHLATNSCDANKNLFRKQSDLEKTWTEGGPPHHIHHILWTSSKFVNFFSFAKKGTLLASAQSHPLVLESWKNSKKSDGGHVSNIFPNLYSMTFHYIDWFIVNNRNGWVWAV